MSMNVFLMEDLDHVSKIAPTPLDPSFAAVEVAIHHLDITALVCQQQHEYKLLYLNMFCALQE